MEQELLGGIRPEIPELVDLLHSEADNSQGAQGRILSTNYQESVKTILSAGARVQVDPQEETMKFKGTIAVVAGTFFALMSAPVRPVAQEVKSKLPHYTVTDLGTLGGAGPIAQLTALTMRAGYRGLEIRLSTAPSTPSFGTASAVGRPRHIGRTSLSRLQQRGGRSQPERRSGDLLRDLQSRSQR